MSPEFPEFCSRLRDYGFEIIESEKLNQLYSFESYHADMQCLKVNDTIFIQKDSIKLWDALKRTEYKIVKTETSLNKKYPDNVGLNAVYIGNKLFCKSFSLDNSVKNYCDKNNIEIININQGYTKCSTAILGDTFITSDKGIFDALNQNRVEGLLISSGHINLNGVDYGFIGGCTFESNGHVYFTGDISKHPDYKLIKEFCRKHNKEIVCLSENKLYDIGGFVVL